MNPDDYDDDDDDNKFIRLPELHAVVGSGQVHSLRMGGCGAYPTAASDRAPGRGVA